MPEPSLHGLILKETFPGHLREAQNAIAQSIKALTKFGNQEQPELAKVLIRNQVDRHSALERLRFFNVAETHFELIEIPTNDVWIRDYGPIILTHPDGHRAVASFRFDGWGGKDGHYYGENAGRDDKVALRLAEHLELPCFESSLVLEGGAIEVDGEGHIAHHRELSTSREAAMPQPAKSSNRHSLSIWASIRSSGSPVPPSMVMTQKGISTTSRDLLGRVEW